MPSHERDLSPAERGALALADAAASLDQAHDTDTFLRALDQNHKVWMALQTMTARHHWAVPDRREVDFALETSEKSRVTDRDVHALVEINQKISQALAGGDLAPLRQRARALEAGREPADGQGPEQWLIDEVTPVAPPTD
jgi:hypothetical protein